MAWTAVNPWAAGMVRYFSTEFRSCFSALLSVTSDQAVSPRN
jgi:hypothetical protein